MCRTKRYVFCAVTVWKRAKILPILVWNGVWLSREVQECMNVFVVSNPNEKETERADANSKWLLRIFLLAFWSKYEWWHNFCLGRSEKGYECLSPGRKRVWKWHFLVWNRVRIWGIRWYSSTKNSYEYPPGLTGQADRC